MSSACVKLNERNFMSAEFARQSFRIIPESGVTIEQITSPEYWANVARRINPHDTIEVVPEDGAFYALLFVTNTGKLSVKTQVLQFVELSEKKPVVTLQDVDDLFDIAYGGGVAKWRVIRKADKEAVSKEPFENRAEAEAWLKQNIRKLMAA